MKIIGFNLEKTSYGLPLDNGGACLAIDGEIKMLINEERLNRKQYSPNFKQSIKYVLENNNLFIGDVDLFVASSCLEPLSSIDEVQKQLKDNGFEIDKEKILPALNNRPEDLEIILKAYEILEREAKNYPLSSACLIHNDISPQHILVDGENVSGVIDLEAATGGDPILEFARWDFKYGKEFPLKDILEGYENKEVLSGDFERKLNFWKIYRSFVSLRYCINNNKQEGINKSIKGIKEASYYFE